MSADDYRVPKPERVVRCPECQQPDPLEANVPGWRYECAACGTLFLGSLLEAQSVAARKAAAEAERMHAKAALERHREENER